jgi:hypothetical protein
MFSTLINVVKEDEKSKVYINGQYAYGPTEEPVSIKVDWDTNEIFVLSRQYLGGPQIVKPIHKQS